MSIFSERLKEARKASGVTQKQTAEFLGMADNAYQMYEHGKRAPNHEITVKLADYFDVSLDYMFGRDSYLKISKPNKKTAK